MGRQTVDFLKKSNRDFNQVLESFLPRNPDDTLGTATGGHIRYSGQTGYGGTDVIIGKGGNGSNFTEANPYSESSTQLYPLGTQLVYGDRKFRYGFMNGAVTAGKLLQQAPHVANHTNMLVTNADATAGGAFSHAAGSTTLSVETAGDTDLTENQYAEGYIHVNDAQGEGQLLRVKSHPAHDHSADPSVVITTYDALKTAIVKNASQLSLTLNPYKDVIVAPVTETGAIVGATVIDMTDDYYGWFVTNGPAAVLAASTLVLGHRVVRNDTTTAGAVMADNGDDLTPVLGQVMASGVVDSEYGLIMLNIQ